MEYEKGVPKNLVQFSEYSNLAFTDTGININDNSRPSKQTLWSSDKIEKRIQEYLKQPYQSSPQPVAVYRPGVGVSGNIGGFNASGNLSTSHGFRRRRHREYPAEIAEDGTEVYPNGYKVYSHRQREGRNRFPRVLRPSWYLSYLIPRRSHYCDKCCNYMEHTWATSWNDDPKLSGTSCNCASKCNHAQQNI